MPLQIPTNVPLIGANGLVRREWLQFFILLQQTLAPGGGFAPSDAAYLLAGADADLPAGRVATSTVTITVDLGTAGQIKWNLAAGVGDVTGPASAVSGNLAVFDGTTGKVIADSGESVASILADALAAAIAATLPVDLASEVFGDLPLSNLTGASAASRLLLRGSAAGAGDWQEGTAGDGLEVSGTVLQVKVDGTTIQFNGSGALEVIGGGGGGGWVPLSAGVEPLAFISDGAGSPILVAYP